MEVKIGVQNVNRELSLESNDSQQDVEKAVSDALKSEGGVLSLTDAKGRTVLVPADKVAYVELGSTSVGTVGYRS